MIDLEHVTKYRKHTFGDRSSLHVSLSSILDNSEGIHTPATNSPSLGSGGFLFRIDADSNLSLLQKSILAFSIKIKTHYQSSRINNYSIEKIKRLTGLSRPTIKKYLKYMDEHNLIRYENNDMIIRSLDHQFTGYRHHSITVYSNNTIKDILAKIDLSVIQQIANRQSYVRTLKRNDQMARISLREYKRTRRIKREHPEYFHGALVDDTIIGTRKLAQQLHCSQSRACYVLKDLEKRKLLTTREYKIVLMRGAPKGFDAEEYKQLTGKRAGYLYQHKGLVVAHLGTIISLP